MISYMEHWCPWCIMVIVADVCLHFRRGTRFAYFRKIVADLPSKNRFVDGACAEETVGYAIGIWNCIWNIWNLRQMFVQENRILMPMSKRGPPMTPVLCSDHFSCISFVFVCCVCRVSCGSPTRSIPDAEQEFLRLRICLLWDVGRARPRKGHYSDVKTPANWVCLRSCCLGVAM